MGLEAAAQTLLSKEAWPPLPQFLVLEIITPSQFILFSGGENQVVERLADWQEQGMLLKGERSNFQPTQLAASQSRWMESHTVHC